MPLPAFIPAIGKALAAVAPSALDFLGRRQQNQAQKEQARQSMAFSERMANTAVQRAKADFEAAGFNPALAYGTQAASPMGQQASIGNELGNIVSSAQAARAASAQLNMISEQLATQKATTAAVTEQGRKAKAEADTVEFARDKAALENEVWQAIARGTKMDLSSPIARSINAQFEASALSPDSIKASNSALAAQAKAQGVSADIQAFEKDFLQRMQTDKGNVSKMLNMLIPILRMFK